MFVIGGSYKIVTAIFHPIPCPFYTHISLNIFLPTGWNYWMELDVMQLEIRRNDKINRI